MEKSVVTIIASSSGLFPPIIHEALLSFCNCGSRWKVLVTGGVKSDWNPITRQMIGTWECSSNSNILNQHSAGTHVPDIYQAMMALCHFQGVTNTYRTCSPHHGRPAQRNLSKLSYGTRQWGGKGGNISASLSLTAQGWRERGGDTSPENRLQHLLQGSWAPMSAWQVLSWHDRPAEEPGFRSVMPPRKKT